jgi:hypothetical protein
MDDFLNDTEELLQKRLARISIADLAARVRGRGAVKTSSSRKRG